MKLRRLLITRVLPIAVLVVALGYILNEWRLYFLQIDDVNRSAFLGFVYFVSGYCLVLLVLVMLGWGAYKLRFALQRIEKGKSLSIIAWSTYASLFIVCLWFVRRIFSNETQFLPENMLLAAVALIVVIVSEKLFEASKQKQLKLTYEKDRQEAELSLLKAQVNPHFLFNALNTLYNDALKIGAEQITTNLEMLTDILRYQLQYAAQQVISLEEEVNFIHQFVDFQKHRFQADKSVDISIDSAISHPDFLIHPMILITFVENAFKHGISRESLSEVHVMLTQEKASLKLEVRNTNYPKTGKMNSGIGLTQAKKLLDALYPVHGYFVESDDQFYQVTLILNLQANE